MFDLMQDIERVLSSSRIGWSNPGSQLSIGGGHPEWTRERERESKRTKRERERE